VLGSLSRAWRIAEVSHKPYPAGRATHAGIEGIVTLRQQHPFNADQVAGITIVGPPVTARLCGRPDVVDPSPNYARLCMAYIAAKVLQHGEIDIAHYRGDALTDPETHRLAQCVVMRSDATTDPNALVPVEVTIALTTGQTLRWRCEAMLASPTRRLTREQHLTKFRRCWTFTHAPMPDSQRDTLIDLVDNLDSVTDVRSLTQLVSPAT
jgi:aconitate decarboxylase